jgi:hypothetical protein
MIDYRIFLQHSESFTICYAYGAQASRLLCHDDGTADEDVRTP